MAFMIFWESQVLMAIGPLTMGADAEVAAVSAQILKLMGYYGYRVGCMGEYIGFGWPVWYGLMETPKEDEVECLFVATTYTVGKG